MSSITENNKSYLIIQLCLYSRVFDIQTVCRLARVSKSIREYAYNPRSLCLPVLNFSKFGKAFDSNVLSHLLVSQRLGPKTNDSKTKISLHLENTSIKFIPDLCKETEKVFESLNCENNNIYEIFVDFYENKIFTGKDILMNDFEFKKIVLRFVSALVDFYDISILHMVKLQNSTVVFIKESELPHIDSRKYMEICERYQPNVHTWDFMIS